MPAQTITSTRPIKYELAWREFSGKAGRLTVKTKIVKAGSTETQSRKIEQRDGFYEWIGTRTVEEG